MRAALLRPLLLLAAASAAAFAGCSADPPPPPDVGKTRAPIIGGRISGDDENAAVYIETASSEPDTAPLRCTGRIIAPGLVVTARHCLLKRRSVGVLCNDDGTPVNPADVGDLSIEPVGQISVMIGATKPGRLVRVREVVSDVEVSLCRSDIALLVLSEPGLDTRTPIRRAPLKLGDRVSVIGWGYRSDAARKAGTLPTERAAIDDIPVVGVGPDRMPAGSFALAGKTVCLGDSGSSALAGGELVGVYSRISDDGQGNVTCELDATRNVFTGVSVQGDLFAIAFSKIGEEPWYAGEQKPWLAAAGEACIRDDECSAGRCDGAKCAVGCGPTGLACTARNVCSPDGQTCTPPPSAADAGAPASAPAADSSCSASLRPSSQTTAGEFVVAGFVLGGMLRRRARRGRY